MDSPCDFRVFCNSAFASLGLFLPQKSQAVYKSDIQSAFVIVARGAQNDCGDFALLRRARRGRGVALELSSESDLAVAADFDLECDRCGTPVGLTAFGFSSSGEIDVGSAAMHRSARAVAQPVKKKRDQRIMGGKLTDKDSMRTSGGYKSLPR